MTSRSSGPHRGQLPFPTAGEPLSHGCADPSGAMTLSSSGRHRGQLPFPMAVEPLSHGCADPSGAHSP
jgi:hypothetical protein